jgi:hypothetical protein
MYVFPPPPDGLEDQTIIVCIGLANYGIRSDSKECSERRIYVGMYICRNDG